jgi:hypothetical protein
MGIIERLNKNRQKSRDKIENAITQDRARFVSPFYSPVVNPDKCASVVLRFLPSADPDKLPYVQLFQHFFKGDSGDWLSVDVCPTTLDLPCPVCECNSKLWNTNIPENQNIARSRARRRRYVANIYLIKDPNSPEREGKVFPFMFGPEIFGIITNAVSPKFKEDESIMPFDFWDGADFNMRVTWQPEKGMPTYKDSKFVNAGKKFLNGDEERWEEILRMSEPLEKWIAPDRLKPYDELIKKCQSAYSYSLDIVTPGFDPVRAAYQDIDPPKRQKREEKLTDDDLPKGKPQEEDEDDLDYLRKLVEN